MSDPIKAALAASGEAVRLAMIKPGSCLEGIGCDLPPCHCAQVAVAAAVVAFLGALPVTRSPTIDECQKARTTTIRPRINYAADTLAAAVERAAKEVGDG